MSRGVRRACGRVARRCMRWRGGLGGMRRAAVGALDLSDGVAIGRVALFAVAFFVRAVFARLGPGGPGELDHLAARGLVSAT